MKEKLEVSEREMQMTKYYQVKSKKRARRIMDAAYKRNTQAKCLIGSHLLLDGKLSVQVVFP